MKHVVLPINQTDNIEAALRRKLSRACSNALEVAFRASRESPGMERHGGRDCAQPGAALRVKLETPPILADEGRQGRV
jgi:hypothetical protein